MANVSGRPANRPSGTEYAGYLEKTLGPGYSVTYEERIDPKTKRVDENQSFYHVVQHSPTGSLAANLRMRLGHATEFMTSYGGQKPRQAEPAIEVLHSGGRTWKTIGGKWESTYGETDTGEPFVSHTVSNPLANLAGTIREGFDTTRQKRMMGSTSATVEGNIFNLLSEGSTEETGGTTPRGSLMMSEIDLEATRRRAAQSIATASYTNPNLRTSEIAQERIIQQSRTEMISGEDPSHPIYAAMKTMGYAPDRDTPNRFTPFAQGALRMVESGIAKIMPYLPTPSFAKHHTITNVARQPVTLLGQGNVPLEPQRLTYAGQGDINMPGYAYTTAQIAGRTPEKSLMLSTLISSQYPIPGAGMYFPETTGVDITGAGYEQTKKTAITSNVRDLLKGKIGFTPTLKEGQVLPSALQYQYGKLTLPGQQPGETREIDLTKRMESANFVVGEQALRIPKYYNPLTGEGSVYNKARIESGMLREVTEDDVDALRQRMGINILRDELTSEVGYELSGMSKQGGKVATGGIKTDIIPYRGAPGVGFTSTGGEQRRLPISMLTFEAKSMPEAYLNSLAALSPDQQSDLLEDYAASYEQEDPGTAQAIREYRNSLANRRFAEGPDIKFRPEELAAHAFTSFRGEPLGPGERLPIHELGKDIYTRLFLGGLTGEQLTATPEQELMARAGSQANIRNLEKYGIGFVAPGIPGMDIEPIVREVSEADVGALKYAFTQSYNVNRQAQNLPAEAPDVIEAAFHKAYGFDPTQTGKMRTQRFTPTGFLMPLAAQPSVEFVGGGTWKAEEVMLLNQIAPTFASNLGLGLMDITSAGAMSRNITDPVHWAQAQIAKVSAMGAARGTKPVFDPEALTITSDIAQRMLSDPDFESLMQKNQANLAGMEDFLGRYKGFFPDVGKASRRTVQFEGAEGHYIMSPRAIRNIMDLEDVEGQEDVTRSINMYMGSFYKALQATAAGEPTQVVRGTSRMLKHFERQFGLPEGEKRNITRTLLGSDLARTVGHYAYWDKLQQQQIYGSEELIKSAIRMELGSQGMDVPGAQLTEREVEETYKYMAGLPSKVGQLPSYAKEQGLPAVMARYPFVAGVESMGIAQLLTPEHMKRMGLETPADEKSGLSTYHWRMGLVPSTGFQGDFDLDYLMVSLGLKGTRDRRGRLSVGLASFDKSGNISPEVLREIQRTANASYPDTMKSLFASATQRMAFDPLMGTLKQDERPTTAGGLGGIASMMGTQMTKAGLYAYDTLASKVATYGAAKMQMGTTYDYTRALESAATVRGWESDKIFRARRGRAGQYQPFLDVSTGVPQPLVNLFQTSYLQEKGGELQMGWRLPGTELDEERAWGQKYRIAGDESAFRLLRGMAGSAIYPHKEAGTELPSPDILAWAFSPEQGRAFDADTLTDEDIAQSDAAYQALVQAKGQGLPAKDIDRLREQYYSGISLESALSRPFGDEGLEFRDRQLGMQDALVEWMRANYGQSPEKIFQSPHMTAALGKAIQSKQTRVPGWELPTAFTGTTVGQDISAIASPFQTMFGLERNRLSPANKLLDLVNWIDKQNPQSTIANWALGAIKNTMGFGTVKQMADFRNLYQQISQSPIELRASEYMGIAHPKPYATQTTLGREQGINQALLKSALYSVGGILGISGREEMHDLVASIFPMTEEDQMTHVLRGKETEAKLGGIMSSENWYSVNRWSVDPVTKEMIPVEEGNKSMRRRSAFNVGMRYADEQGQGFAANIGATPDFLRLYRKEGQLHVQSIEQKTPALTRHARQEDVDRGVLNMEGNPAKRGELIPNTFEDIRTGIAEGSISQGRLASWIVSEKLKRNDPQEIAELRETLGTYNIPEDLMDETIETLRTRGMETMSFIPQEGSAAYEEIHSARPDPKRITQHLMEDPWKTEFVPSGPNDPELQLIGGTVEQAAQIAHANRPKALSDVWRRLQAAPGFWQAQKAVARAEGMPWLGRLAGRSLDVARLAWHGMRSIGSAAEQAVGVTAVPAGQTTAIREAAAIGPYTQQTVRGGGLTIEELNRKIAEQEASIEEHAGLGTAMEVGGKDASGVRVETRARAIGEIAEKMGYRSNISLFDAPGAGTGQPYDKAEITFAPIGPEPQAPVPPTSGRPWEQDPAWMGLAAQHRDLGVQLNQADPQDRQAIANQMDAIGAQMQSRAAQVGRGQQGQSYSDYAQALMGYGTAQQRWQQKVTVSRIPTPVGAAQPAQQTTTQQTTQQQPPAGGFMGPIPAGGTAGGVGGGGTTSTGGAPSPDADRPGMVRPTADVQQFVRMYGDYRDLVSQQAYEFRQTLGGAERGKAIGALGQMQPEEVRARFHQFRYTSALATQLLGAAQKAIRAKDVDLSKVHPDYLKMAYEIAGTESEVGQDVLDLTAMAEMGTKGIEGERRFLQQTVAFELASKMSAEGVVPGIRGAMGLPMQTPQGQPIMDLSGLLGSTGTPLESKDLFDYLNANPQVKEMLRQSYQVTRGVSEGRREEVFGRSPQVVEMARLAEQISRVPGGEFITKASRTATGLPGDLATEQSQRLSKLSSELADNFEKLKDKSGDTADAIERIPRLMRDIDIEEARTAAFKAALPLEEAGILRRAATPRVPGVTEFEPTGAAVSADLYDQYEQYVGKTARLGQLEAGRVSDFRPDEEGGTNMARLLRRTLGGFGIMYMRSLWNIATGGLTTGMEERVGMDAVYGQMASQVTGQPFVPYNQMQVLQNRMALAGTSYSPLLASQNLAAQTPFLGDLGTFAGAGLGTYALAQQMGMWGGPSSLMAAVADGGAPLGRIFGSRVPSALAATRITAPHLAMAVGAIATGLSASAKMEDVEGTAFKLSRLQSGEYGFMQKLGTLFSSEGLARDWDKLFGQGDIEATTGEYAGLRTQVEAGARPEDILRGVAPRDRALALQRLSRLYTERSPQYTQEAMAKAISTTYTYGMPGDKATVEAMAGLEQQGLGADYWSSMLGLAGYTPQMQLARGAGGQAMLGQVMQQVITSPMEESQRVLLQSGLQGLSGIAGPAMYYMAGIGPGATGGMADLGRMEAALAPWQDLFGTPAETVGGMQLQNWYRQMQFGVPTQQPTPTQTRDPLGLMREQLVEERTARGLDITEEYGKLTNLYLQDVVPAPGRGIEYAAQTLQGMDIEEQERALERLQSVIAIRRLTRENLGMPSTPQDFQDLLAMTPEQRDTEGQRRQRIAALQEQLRQSGMPQQQIQTRINQLMGITDMRQFETQEGQMQGAMGAGQAFRSWGLDLGQREAVTQRFLQMQQQGRWTPWREDFTQRLAKFDPWAMTQGYAYGEKIPGVGDVPAWMVSRDILGPQFGAMQGTPVDIPAFALSGATHPRFGMLQQMMPQGTFGQGAGLAFSQGYRPSWSPTALPGTMGMQAYLSDMSYQAQMAQIGNQMAQWQLGRAFNTGVGINAYQGIINPQTGSPFGFNTGKFGFNIPGAGQYTSQGGGFWGVQDASRNLGYVQQEWQQGFQQQQMQMQQRQWGESFALQQKQALMQRPWAQQDWAYQDLTRGLQWGWRQEDFAEQRRFMTGRDRRLAERGMQRETIMHDLEGEQIDKQRERQKETWKLEDERFDLSRKHNQEQLDMQIKQMDMSKKFYEERKKLEEEQVLLQRAYQIEQMNLQKQAIGAQAELAKRSKEAQDIQNAIALLNILLMAQEEDLRKNLSDSQGETQKWVDATFQAIVEWLKTIGVEIGNLGGDFSPPSNGRGTTPNAPLGDDDWRTGSAVGNYLSAGQLSTVNEQGDEVFRPYWSGEVIPLTKYDPWKTTVVQNQSQPVSSSQPRIINVYIGNRHLGQYILDEVDSDLRIP
jgi:hypothetical protein